jgi:thiol-disulfide isomerase/thioredoxin
MSRKILKLVSVLLFFVVSATIADEKTKITSLDEANTVEEISTFASNQLSIHLEKAPQGFAAQAKLFSEVGEIWIAGGEKILKITNDETEQTKGMELKVGGLRLLIRADRNNSRGQKSKHQVTLDNLINELEKEKKFPLVVNNERIINFLTDEANDLRMNFTTEKFDKFVKRAKKLSLAQPTRFEPFRPLLKTIEVAALAKDAGSNHLLVEKTLKDFIAFVNSEEFNLSTEEKEKTLEQLEGYSLRLIGANPEIYGKTVDNTDFDWVALRGKYVLVKFTASWCGPCKAEIPGLLSAYKKYHDKGFEIISIYIRDKLDATKKIIEDEKIPWICLSEELTEKNGLPLQEKKYAISSVPTMFLIDKDGKIIFTEARGETLQKKLAELFPDEK